MAVTEWLQLFSILMVAIVAGINMLIVARVKSIHVELNSRLSALLALTAKTSRAEGAEQQRKDSAAKSPE